VVFNPNYSATHFLSTTYNFWTLDSKKQSLETNSTFLSSPILSTQEIWCLNQVICLKNIFLLNKFVLVKQREKKFWSRRSLATRLKSFTTRYRVATRRLRNTDLEKYFTIFTNYNCDLVWRRSFQAKSPIVNWTIAPTFSEIRFEKKKDSKVSLLDSIIN
jgi:hypothetical protein